MNEDYEKKEITKLIKNVRNLCENEEYDNCLESIYDALKLYPDSPVPQNLLGIVLEKKGDHSVAMRHFRAAWALNPSYSPANHNLHNYGTFFSDGICAYDESDVPEEKESELEVLYDKYGVGHIVSRDKVVYDEHGIGRIIREEQ